MVYTYVPGLKSPAGRADTDIVIAAIPHDVARTSAAPGALFVSYAALTRTLLQGVGGTCLLDGQLRSLGADGGLDAQTLARAIQTHLGGDDPNHFPFCLEHAPGARIVVLPLEQTDGTLLGVFCIQQTPDRVQVAGTRHAGAVARQLKPVLDCLHRELAASRPESAKVRVLTERTAELEWLFELTGKLKGCTDERRVVEELLHAANERLNSGLTVLYVPEKHLCLKHGTDLRRREALEAIWEQTHKHLINWVERQNRPMMINGTPGKPKAGHKGRCKILAVPVARDTGRVIGLLAFFNPPEAADFAPRQVFLARHLGRQAAALVEAQFDLMTGLYTRDGLEQMYSRLAEDPDSASGSLLYLDIDRMDLVNELHGFELGNEVIVRVAELLTPPAMPAEALTGRLSGDGFAVVLPDIEPDEAAKLAAKVQTAINKLAIGPVDAPVEVSVSCGVAAIVNMPQGLARALSAAEIACKKAKARGRNRAEIYTCSDASMMRRNDDIAAVGQLRAAFKADQVVLYAQRIAPLQNPNLPGSYEILMRLRQRDGSLVSPGPLIGPAQRYQLLPTIDRRVMERTLNMLAPYRSCLSHSGVAFSINVTGQSICDEAFVGEFVEKLRNAHLPAGSLTIEITEQAAVTNLARASEMVGKLGALGCRLALDDFGTGANSLAYLKSLQVARVKIDGSFVRDLLTERRSESTVRAIVELAKGYGIDTVAEYVESREIANKLRLLGVDYAQGYAFGKPEPLEEVLTNLSHDESRRLHKLFLEM